LIAVDEINIQTLTNYIQEYLIKHQDKFLKQNPIEILDMTYQNSSFTILWGLCLEKICETPEILFNSDKFISLKAPLLELLFKRDDLSLDEIIIWDNLIKWCLAQHPNISQDPTKWNKDEIAIVERTIHGFIPLIRFNHISSEDFIIKVYPFKEIMPKDLVNNTLIYHMAPNKRLNANSLPPRQPKCIYDSILIKTQHFAIFSSWIEKKNNSYYNVKNIPYDFNLLYRASRDGNTAKTFHTKCDYNGATIVIVKASNSDQILGGYNPLSWDSTNNWCSTSDSFIFSFSSSTNFETAIVGHINAHCEYAIYCFHNYGPAFGGGHDLYLDNDNSWRSNNPYSYPELDMPKGNKMGSYNTFSAEDYEVFQVIKKQSD
jgi:hypothetical protein